MRMTVAALVAVSLGQLLLQGQQIPEVRKARLRAAQRWLKSLDVKYEGDFVTPDLKALELALETWEASFVQADPPPPTVLKSAIPGNLERVARIGTFSAERLSTQRSVYGARDTTPETKEYLPNPDHALYSFTGSLSPGELYISVADRTGLCKAAQGLWKAADSLKTLHCDDAVYLSASRRKDLWGRAALSVKMEVSGVQIPKFREGLVFSGKPPGRDWNKTISGSFDPVLLFRSPGEWASWADFYKNGTWDAGKLKHSRILPTECRNFDSNQKDQQLISCYERLVRGSKRHQAITTILPMVTVKAYTPYDLVKLSGGTTLVQPPGGARSIYDVVFSWDAKKVIPSASSRAQALAAFEGFRHPPKLVEAAKRNKSLDSGNAPDLIAKWREEIRGSYLALARSPEIAEQDKWWEVFSLLMIAKPQ